METSSYIILGPVDVADMSATHPDIINGYPMPTAVAGFGYKTVLDLNKEFGGCLTHLGTAVVVHKHSMMEGHPKNPVEIKGKLNQGAPIVDEYKARAEVTFIIALNEEPRLSETGDMLPGVDPDLAKSFLARRMPGWSFGGGKIFVPSGKRPDDLVKFVPGNEIGQALSIVGAGYVLVDRRDLLELERTGEEDALDALFNCVEFIKQAEPDGKVNDGDGTEKAAKRKHPGWIVPLLVGFQGIERPSQRGGTRVGGAVNHVYAESIYSIGEYKSLKGMLAADDDPLEASLWRHCRHKASETFYVSAIETI